MFKPQRLVYRQTVSNISNIKDFIGETPGKMAQAPVEYAGEVTSEIGESIKYFGEAAKEAVNIGPQAMVTLEETILEDIVGKDAVTPLVTLLKGEAAGIEGVLVDTPLDLFSGQYKKAAQSFFEKGLGNIVGTPLKTVWQGIKGVINLPLHLGQGVARVGSDVVGVKYDKQDGWGWHDHGLLPALGNIGKGILKTGAGLFGKEIFARDERPKVIKKPKERMDIGLDLGSSDPLFNLGESRLKLGWKGKWGWGKKETNSPALAQPNGTASAIATGGGIAAAALAAAKNALIPNNGLQAAGATPAQVATPNQAGIINQAPAGAPNQGGQAAAPRNAAAPNMTPPRRPRPDRANNAAAPRPRTRPRQNQAAAIAQNQGIPTPTPAAPPTP